ncbi:MAG: hypothetical protein ABSG43_09205 [Solirubrobacteraceae bacterium]
MRRSSGSSAHQARPASPCTTLPGEILDTTVGRLRTAYDVDVLGAVVAAQVAAPVLRTAGTSTLLFTSGGFADHPVPALASLPMGKAGLRRRRP